LHLAGASKWVFKGLMVQNTKNRLVDFLNHDFQGPTDNVVFEGNHVQTQPDVGVWTQQDWVNQGAYLGINDQAACAIIKDNQLRNIRNGMAVSGSGALIEGNVIDNFGDDAIDITASRITLRQNRITNNHNLADGNHNDAIQGWTVSGATNHDILVEGNTIIASTNPGLSFPGDMQGISVFDGKWENVIVRNNVVVTNTYHGIALYGVRGAEIVNNTVIGTRPDVVTWIGVFDTKKSTGGAPPENVVIHNNIARKYNLNSSGITEHHNVTAGNPEDLFAKFDVAHAQYDLHLSPRSPAKGAGSPKNAPPVDIIGKPRVGPIDAGAYASTGPQ
jgi:parallel beta-helix repeat protein